MSALSENCHHDRATVDGEHRMQIELIEALQASLHHPTGTRPGPTVLMDQLQSFCAAHFMSEELLMRFCAYPELDDHIADHERTLDTLAGIALNQPGDPAAAEARLSEIKGFLTAHIRTRDLAFTEYYRRWSEVGSADRLVE